jgi:uncharacterized LabA/DUF88 family protein
MKTYIYIDGFNLYYNCLKKTPYKWLDLKKLCQSMLNPENEILKIRYFTAKVTGKFDPMQPIRQATYLRALKHVIPEIEIHMGKFLTHEVPMLSVNPPPKIVKVYKTEEKRSDVNLAVHLLNDAWHNHYECAVIISNDSDLSESLRLIKTQHHTKKIGVFSTADKPSKELNRYTHFRKIITSEILANCLLPNPIPNTNLRKPDCW